MYVGSYIRKDYARLNYFAATYFSNLGLDSLRLGLFISRPWKWNEISDSVGYHISMILWLKF